MDIKSIQFLTKEDQKHHALNLNPLYSGHWNFILIERDPLFVLLVCFDSLKDFCKGGFFCIAS